MAYSIDGVVYQSYKGAVAHKQLNEEYNKPTTNIRRVVYNEAQRRFENK